ncbi:haloacid dehalogenase, partial [Leptospira adleri]
RFQKSVGALADLAFGDSVNDFPLLESSALGVFLDREKGTVPPQGTKIQSLRGWKVLEGISV